MGHWVLALFALLQGLENFGSYVWFGVRCLGVRGLVWDLRLHRPKQRQHDKHILGRLAVCELQNPISGPGNGGPRLDRHIPNGTCLPEP